MHNFFVIFCAWSIKAKDLLVWGSLRLIQITVVDEVIKLILVDNYTTKFW